MDHCPQTGHLPEFSSFLEGSSPGTQWSCPSCFSCDHPKGIDNQPVPDTWASQNEEDAQPATAGRSGRSETSGEQPSQPRLAKLLWTGTINKCLFLYATEILWFSHYIALFCQWISDTLQLKHSTIEERCNVMQALRMLCRHTVIPQHQWGDWFTNPRGYNNQRILKSFV